MGDVVNLTDAKGAKQTKRGRSHASKLVDLVVASGAELFHSPQGDPYATMGGETLSITGPDFKRRLARDYFNATKKVPSASALADAVAVLAGSARFHGPEREVYTRVAAVDDAVFLDLGRQVVKVTADGWEILPSTDEVRFLRSQGFLPLPTPVRGETPLADLLRTFINVGHDQDLDDQQEGDDQHDDQDLHLVIAWLVAALRGRKPFPILSLTGEQGSAKSSTCRYLRRLVDPNVADSRVTPREMRDLTIAARNSYVLSFENLTRITDWLADGLCCLSTGAGSATRQLCTDTDEVIISAARPILLNGINDVLHRPDLLDRAIVVTLEPIPDERRQTEVTVDAVFHEAQPAILAALLDAVACALTHEPTTCPERLPRMADFAITITAAEPALGWTPGSFLTTYDANRQTAVESILEGNPLVVALRALLTRDRPVWDGTATELREALLGFVDDPEWFPHTAKTMGNQLRGAAPGLRAMKEIDVRFYIARGKRRIELKTVTKSTVTESKQEDIPF